MRLGETRRRRIAIEACARAQLYRVLRSSFVWAQLTCTDAARVPPTIAADRGNRASATTNFILICAIVLAVNRAVNHLVMLGNFLTPHATKR